MNKPIADVELHNQFGFIIVQWGHCEQSLELLTNILYSEYDCKKLTCTKRIPRPLLEKLKFVKRCALEAPSLALYKAELDVLVKDFSDLSQKRHDIVHGALTNTLPINGVFTFIRLETHPDHHEIKEFQYDLSEFPSLKTKLMRLGDFTVKLTSRLWREHQTL
jgi:hypothetical protein